MVSRAGGWRSRRRPPIAAPRCGRHMPELVPSYDDVCGLVGDDDLAHRILSHYRPPSFPHGCSQTIWLGNGGPALVRNYDYPLGIISDRIELTAWSGRRVIAKAQRPWGGCLDGMNDDGLVASLTFGGIGRNGQGFAIILMSGTSWKRAAPYRRQSTALPYSRRAAAKRHAAGPEGRPCHAVPGT